VCEFRGLRLTERQTNNENGLAGARICRTLRAVERNYVNVARDTNNNGVVPRYAIYRNFSLREMES